MLYCYSIRILLYVIVYFYHSLFIHVLIWYNMIFNMVHFSSFLLLLLMLISIMELHIMWCCVSPTRFLKENKLACILRSAFPSIVSPPFPSHLFPPPQASLFRFIFLPYLQGAFVSSSHRSSTYYVRPFWAPHPHPFSSFLQATKLLLRWLISRLLWCYSYF